MKPNAWRDFMTRRPIDDFYDHELPKSVDKNESVFKTRQEADEALAKKYGNRKDYNKMNEFKNVVVCIDGEYYKPRGGELKMNPFERPFYRLEVSMDPMYKIKESPANTCLVKDVIFNPPATIVFWIDGTKTVVKAGKGDEFDPEKGLAMAIAKKAFGNQGNYFNVIKKYVEDYRDKNFVDDAYDFPPEPLIDNDHLGEVAKSVLEKTKEALRNSVTRFVMHGDDECQTK